MLEVWEECYCDQSERDADPDQLEEMIQGGPPGLTLRPRLTITPSGGDAGFITVHDYVSALHPWLMSLRELLIEADNVFESNRPGYCDKIMVKTTGPDRIMIDDERRYATARKGTDREYKYKAGETALKRLRAQAENGDLEAATESIILAQLWKITDGLSPKVMQGLYDRNAESQPAARVHTTIHDRRAREPEGEPGWWEQVGAGGGEGKRTA